ncbi:MAG: type II toxin-antitoxin system HicA family toxin [Chloroflexi bacterium]|nr:type II toxin-antitoxin system HicA family toxin [Chloroflexota bacterium]
MLRHLRKHGCVLLRQGSGHSVYWQPVRRTTSTVPRPAEVADTLAHKICKDLGIPPPQLSCMHSSSYLLDSPLTARLTAWYNRDNSVSEPERVGEGE